MRDAMYEHQLGIFCCQCLGKTLNSHSPSLHPDVQMGTSDLKLGVTLRWISIPSRGDCKCCKLLHVTQTGNKHWPDWPLCSYADYQLKLQFAWSQHMSSHIFRVTEFPIHQQNG